MRSPLTETFKRVTGMIAYVRENLDDQEYDLFLDLINPEPETKVVEKPKPTKRKKIEHCEVCDLTRRALVHKDESVRDYHEFQSSKPIPRCAKCGLAKESITHRQADLNNYHEFQSSQPKSKRAKGMAAAISESLQRSQEAKVDDGDSDDISERLCGEYINGLICDRLADHNVHHLATYLDYHEFTSGKSHALVAGEGL